jgi:tRNA(Arg) A34 adenosine deaminase TadA
MQTNKPGLDLSIRDYEWMRRAIEESGRAARTGGSPFGAVVAHEEQLIGIGCNETQRTGSPIRHAEIVAIESALTTSNGVPLTQATLYTSCAPCIMCLSTAYYAGIRRVIYAIEIGDVVALGSGDPSVEPETINNLLGLGLQIYSGVFRAEALEVVRNVFEQRGEI